MCLFALFMCLGCEYSGCNRMYRCFVSHPYPKGQLSLMGDKCQHLHCQYGAPTLHHENISSYCRQQLWLHLNLGKKILSDEILLSVDLTTFCATCHGPARWRKRGRLRGKQRKGEEGWCQPSPTPTSTSTFMQTDKLMETRSRLVDMYDNRKIRPARWYESSVFFTSNRCRLHAPCSLTHGYLMSTASLSGNLICWPTVVKTKTSHQTNTLHVVLLWFDLIKH